MDDQPHTQGEGGGGGGEGWGWGRGVGEGGVGENLLAEGGGRTIRATPRGRGVGGKGVVPTFICCNAVVPAADVTERRTDDEFEQRMCPVSSS